MSMFRSKPWHAQEYRRWVASLPCCCDDPRCPNCTGGGYDNVEAAHLRSHTGMGQKPSDLRCYPLSATMHRIFHSKEGQPDVAWQLDRVTETLDAALATGVLVLDKRKAKEETG